MFTLRLDDKGTRIFEDMFYDKYQKISWRTDELWKQGLDTLFTERYTTEAMKVSMATYHKLTSTRQALINNPNYMYQNKPSIIPTNDWVYNKPLGRTIYPTTSINPYPNPSKLANTPNSTGNTPNSTGNTPNSTSTPNSTGNTLYSLSTDMVRINDTEITRQELYDLLDSTKPASCATCKGYSPMGMYLIPDTDGLLCDWVCLYFCSDNCKGIYSLTGGVS